MENLEHHFYLTVDGKKYGPFPIAEKESYNNLHGKKGVEFFDVWLPPKPKVKRKVKKKASDTPLLEGIGWLPVRK